MGNLSEALTRADEALPDAADPAAIDAAVAQQAPNLARLTEVVQALRKDPLDSTACTALSTNKSLFVTWARYLAASSARYAALRDDYTETLAPTEVPAPAADSVCARAKALIGDGELAQAEQLLTEIKANGSDAAKDYATSLQDQY